MPRVTVSYNDYSFTVTGRPAFSRETAYEPPASEAKAQKAIVTWSVHQEFAEQTFADNAARYAALLTALRTPEGVLLIRDENGRTLFNERVRVVGHSLPEQWGAYILETTVQFRSVRTDLASTAGNLTFTPTGKPAVTLPGVRGYRESVRTERVSYNGDHRVETVVTISASGAYTADGAISEEARRTALHNRLTEIKSIANHPNGTLTHGAESHVVRVDQVDADLADGTERVEWTLAASYRCYPQGSEVTVSYELDQRVNVERAEALLTVSGQVHASTRDAAEQRVAAIGLQYTTGRTLLENGSKVTLVDGPEAADGWVGLAFSFAFRQALSVVSWDLSVSDRDDVKSGALQTTYSGRVTAHDAAAALAKARDLGEGKWPMRMGSTETVTSKAANGAEFFVEVAFSYEYQRRGTRIFAEVTGEVNMETFGAATETVSGYVAAATLSAAHAVAETFRLSGRLQRSERITDANQHITTTPGADQFERTNFSYTYFLARTAASVSFTVEESKDYESRRRTMNYSGTAYGADADACDTLIDGVIAGETGSLLRETRTSANERAQSMTAFLSRSFQLSYVRALTAVPGEDILLADYTVARVFSVPLAVFTRIPGADPYVEPSVCNTEGQIAISGQVTALTEAAARTWARGKRTLLDGFYEDPPREEVNYQHLPKSTTVVLLHRFGFQYAGKCASLALT